MCLSWLPLLLPFLYVAAKTRTEASGIVLAYYLGALWPVMSSARSFFGTHFTTLLPPALLAGGTIFGAFTWIAFYNRRFPAISAVAALALLSVPPLSLVTLAYPLIAAGAWFPGTHWLGLALPVIALIAAWRIRPLVAVIALGLIAGGVHAAHRSPPADPSVVCVNTRFGGSTSEQQTPDVMLAQAKFIQDVALSHPGAIVIFPEGTVQFWSRATDELWKSELERMAAQKTTLLLGAAVPIPNTQANYNMLIARGAGRHLAYVERVPIPLGMWQPGRRDIGFPLQLSAPATILVNGKRAAVLMCYEQLLAWPALQSLAQHPVMLIAPSNDYWAARTRIPHIQHEAAQNWADLWGIPLYEARNE